MTCLGDNGVLIPANSTFRRSCYTLLRSVQSFWSNLGSMEHRCCDQFREWQQASKATTNYWWYCYNCVYKNCFVTPLSYATESISSRKCREDNSLNIHVLCRCLAFVHKHQLLLYCSILKRVFQMKDILVCGVLDTLNDKENHAKRNGV